MTEAEVRGLRESVCEICKKMWRLGWVAATDGNVSLRLSNEVFLGTPAGVSLNDVTPGNLVLFDRRGKSLRKPSSEIKMHLRCYNERDDVKAVVHAHPPCATAFAIAGRALDDYSMIETVLTLGSVPVAPYATPSTDEVGDSIAPFLQMHDALLLQNHGAITLGCDLITAFHRMETLEHWAKTIINAEILGGAKSISRDNIVKLCELRGQRYGITGRHPGYCKAN
ncbi:MAG: class II aldolase/adducin family protein [Oscillospiraceae bacterium]|nr:class II aldolase/adducin family protein [Oscillospiraceae bacterium]